MIDLKLIIEWLSKILETSGVVIIVVGSLFFILKFLVNVAMKKIDSYKTMRQGLGKTILLGLEILVAADIIHTVITDPELNQVFALGIIVLIRTFLSLSLQVELEGKFPWQKN
jgi:uncharacterized membrane protein